MGKEDFDTALLEVVMRFGKKDVWDGLERRHLRMGYLDVYAGRNKSEDAVVFSMAGKNVVNIVSAVGYPDLLHGCEFAMRPQETTLFGVQVLDDLKQAGSCS